MKLKFAVMALLSAGLLSADAATGQPLRVFIRASAKTHGPGEHDYPQFLQDWKKLLKQRGAAVNGALAFPTEKQLEKTDVLILYCSDGSSVGETERARLEAFAHRGGGIVALHDAICGTNAAWLKTLIGGAKQHGVTNWERGVTELNFGDYRHPVTEGVSNFDLNDELFYRLHLMPETRALATIIRRTNEIVPQMWVYENGASRAFVSLQGHYYASFSLPHYRGLLLRGIAWAGKRDVDLLTTPEERGRFRYPEGGPAPPAEAVKKIKVPPDFDISLVASEPLLVRPIALDWDARGRMWVAVAPGNPSRPDGSSTQSSLLILEDADGDGRMDKRRIFYEATPPLTSFVFSGDGVIVAQGSQILWLHDTDGDGAADKKDVLYEGFGPRGSVSNFRWGLDGWVYATKGGADDLSTNVIGTAGRPFGKVGSGVIRFKPDGSAIEVVASYNGTSGGLDFSWDGELFFSKTNGPHVSHVVMPERFLAIGRIGNTAAEKSIEDHQKVFPLITDRRPGSTPVTTGGGFTAASGAMIYDGAAWPMKYLGSYFVCEPNAHLAHEDVITATESVSYEAIRREEEEFIASTDHWFHPLQMRFGPDGAMYLLDTYDPPIAPDESGRSDAGPLDGNASHGRIWRIQHKEARRLESVPLYKASGARLAQALEHPNGWVRMTAQRLLIEKHDLGAVEKLSILVTNRLAYTRVHALWCLHHLGALTETNLMLGVTNSHPAVQRNALRIVETAGGLRSAAAEKTILKLFKDTDDRTRLHAMLALSHMPLTTNGLQAVLKLFIDLKDGWSKSAVLGLARLAPMDYLKGAFASDKSESFRELAAPLVETMAQKKQSAQAALVVRLAARHPTATEKLNVTVLQTLARYVGPDFAPEWSDELEAALKKLFTSKSHAVQIANLPLATHWQDNADLLAEAKKVGDELLVEIQNSKLKDEERNALLTNLVSVQSLRSRLVVTMGKMLTASNTPAPIQKQIIIELGHVTEKPAADALIESYPLLAGDLRQLAFSTIVKRAESASLLVDALEKGAIRSADLGALGISRLRHYPDPTVARRANEVIDALQGPPVREKATLIAQFKGHLDQPFDRKNGKEMFKQNCALCHKLAGDGKDLGPDLTGEGLHDPAVLLAHILDPNRVVEGNSVPYDVTTKKQEDYFGLVARTNKDSVTLRGLEGDVELARADITAIRSAGRSFMPDGFEMLGEQTIRDIIGYLADKAPKGFRPLELAPAFTADSRKGLYEQSDTPQLEFKKFGMVLVDSVPFDIASPSATPAGKNLIVLQGGTGFARTLPRRVEVAVNTKATKIHVLGGVAGWGYPGGEESGQGAPAARLVLKYTDGVTEEIILKNGEQFADYARQIDVPGSKYAPDLVAHGQLRWFTVAPKRQVEIKTLVIESYNNHLAPTFVALTAQVGP
jgi:putative membrane-bound dehydrogenase-like protein